MWKNGIWKTDKESTYPESRGEMEAGKKTEIAKWPRMSGSKFEPNDKQKELETVDRERSKRKVRGRKKTMEKEIMVNSSLMTVMPRK